jgi:hypothetical protein
LEANGGTDRHRLPGDPRGAYIEPELEEVSPLTTLNYPIDLEID